MQEANVAEYPDRNGNGIPDVFENRPSLIEVLNQHDGPTGEGTAIVEVETSIRAANQGEWFLGIHGIERCPTYEHNRYRGYVVRRWLSKEPEIS